MASTPSTMRGFNNLPKASDTFPTLVTQRLRLRRFEPHDAADLHSCFGDEGAMRFWNFPTCKTLAETRKKVLVRLSKTTRPYDHLAWAICKRSNGRCIGMVSYHHRNVHNRRLQLGYIVAPKHHNSRGPPARPLSRSRFPGASAQRCSPIEGVCCGRLCGDS